MSFNAYYGCVKIDFIMSEQELTQPEAYISDFHPLTFGEEFVAEADLEKLFEIFENQHEYGVCLAYELWRTGRTEDIYKLSILGVFQQSMDLFMEKMVYTGSEFICKNNVSETEYLAFTRDIIVAKFKGEFERDFSSELLSVEERDVEYLMFLIQCELSRNRKGFFAKSN